MKRNWAATPDSLRRLVTWLDGGVATDGQSYVAMHRRLASYFARKRCRASDDLADEALSRVARRLEEVGAIDGVPAQYCYIVARFVFLEHLRHPEQHSVPLKEDAPGRVPADKDEDDEQGLACLDGCLDALDAADRELILEYYAGEQGYRIRSRRRLAARLGLSANALTIRASRLRERLRACVTKCSGE